MIYDLYLLFLLGGKNTVILRNPKFRVSKPQKEFRWGGMLYDAIRPEFGVGNWCL